jgi:hexosaminidase
MRKSRVVSWGTSFLILFTVSLRAQSFDVVPYPAHLTPGSGSFEITASTVVALEGRGALERLGRQLRDVVREATGHSLSVTRRSGARSIVLRRLPDEADSLRESYTLLVTPDSVLIASGGDAGLFYGIQTLRQLLPPSSHVPPARSSPLHPAPSSLLPAVLIRDHPRFTWRGMHLDVGRHMFPVAFLERYLDLMARYKLNTFHWHLTEDQGWRIEIRRYPRLTEVGSCRRETIVRQFFDPYVGDGAPYCGFYTQDDIRHIVRYAAERHITVVPEVEMPGHSVAALAAYPELGCTSGPFEVFTRWGVSEDVYCPHERTFEFLENVLGEVLELFPSRYIHVGGDEVPRTRWRASPEAQQVMRREGLRDEDELQSWFLRRIERFLSSRGRRLVGWDEILEGGLAPNSTVMSWRGTAGGIAAARAGHDVVMTPTSHLYFDYYQGDPRFEPFAIGGFVPLERVYSFEPIPDELTPVESGRILGAQGNVWTEYMRTSERVEYMALPRMLALAEVAWSPREARDWDSFVARLPARLAELDRLGVNYRVPHVAGLEEELLTLSDSVVVTLRSAAPGAVIRYTTDGSDPDSSSTAYRSPLALRFARPGEAVLVTARAFLPNGRTSAPRSARFARTSLRPADSVDGAALLPGIAVRMLTGRASRLADLDTLRLAADTAAADVALTGTEPAEDFALVFAGFIRVPEGGVWRFRLTSDDGSDLRIGGRLVVDHDGLHGAEEKSGMIALGAGYHPISVRYFQRGGGKARALTVERSDGGGRRTLRDWLVGPPRP